MNSKGKSAALSAPSDVLVRGNTIERISASPITVETNANVHVIAANGRVLMPSLIDAHWHAFMAAFGSFHNFPEYLLW
jgi:imidazolonepropionase-like amidohydrolase